MHTSTRPWEQLAERYPSAVLDVLKAMDLVRGAFEEAFPGALYSHELLLFREWASLASVTFSVLENFKFSGHVTEPDSRRIVNTVGPIVSRIRDVKNGAQPLPGWATGHRPVNRQVRAHSC